VQTTHGEDVNELRIFEFMQRHSAFRQVGCDVLGDMKPPKLCLTTDLPEERHAMEIHKQRILLTILLPCLAADAHGTVADLLHCPVDLLSSARPDYALLPSFHRADHSSAALQATGANRCR